jgi:hypothetical protein
MRNVVRQSLAALLGCTLALACAWRASARQLAREQWGGTAVAVSRAAGRWTIAGRKSRVTLDESDLSIRVQAGREVWEMLPSSARDALVRSEGEDFYLRLADARRVAITPYDTGYKTGVKIALGGWRDAGLSHRGEKLGLSLTLTVCLEGADEELVFDAAAREGETTLRQLDWPTALDARAVDYTVLSNGRGTLLPLGPAPPDEKTLGLIRVMAALHARVGLLEMTRHEFLGEDFRRERTTFADGTTVTVDWDADSYQISPELTPAG